MGVKQYKPTSPGRRFQTVSDFAEITTDKPEKSLLAPLSEQGGPQQQRPHHDAAPGRRQQAPLPHHRLQAPEGRRAREGRYHRVRPEPQRPHRPSALRRRREALHPSSEGPPRGRHRHERPRGRYQAGQRAAAGQHPRRHAHPRRGAAAGQGRRHRAFRRHQHPAHGQEGTYAILRMPSSEMRRVLITCRATVGEVGNAEHANIKIGKAGRNRWKGIAPASRGTVMNPVDHPHGGGEGKNKSAGRHPVTPWGVPTKGHRTRNPKKASSRLIIRRRRSSAKR